MCHGSLPSLKLFADCLTCAQDNPKQGPTRQLGIQNTSAASCENVLLDLTESSWGLLVYASASLHLLGWVEAFPTWTEKAQSNHSAVKAHHPKFVLLLTLGLDNGPPLVTKVVQELTQIIKIKWKLHIVYWSWSWKSREHEPDAQTITEKVLPTSALKMESRPGVVTHAWNPALGRLMLETAKRPSPAWAM